MRIFNVATVAAIACSVAVSVRAQPPSFLMAACGGETTRVAEVTLPHAVLADGKPLPAGRYEVQLTTQHPTAVAGAAQEAACWAQFVRDGVMQGRELATIIAPADLAEVAKGPGPKRNAARVDLLKEGDYYRIWINHEGTNYIINVPPAS